MNEIDPRKIGSRRLDVPRLGTGKPVGTGSAGPPEIVAGRSWKRSEKKVDARLSLYSRRDGFRQACQYPAGSSRQSGNSGAGRCPRHFLSILSQGDPPPLEQGSGRLQLAELIVKQPIAMRVIVNRIWKGHFGTGIVDTPSNFGFGGERPTNPELLEYLATLVRQERDVDQEAAARNHAERGLSTYHRERRRRIPRRIRAIGFTGAPPQAHGRRAGSRLYPR